jgi:glycosyltransferase involved in cell wall biosynthesis
MESPESAEWEVLVVNNNSTDDTETVSKSFHDSLPLKYVFEPKPGLSNARNTAIRESNGDYIIFIDDDVILPGHWLQAYVNAFQAHPEASVFGGPIEPLMEGTPPSWMESVLPKTGVAYAAINFGTDEMQLTDRMIPFGANMAFRTVDLPENAFDPELGRVAGSMIGYEEVALLQYLITQKGSGWWVPEAHLQHVIPPERQTISYLRRYWKGSGRSVVRVGYGGNVGRGITFFGSKPWVWKQAILCELFFRIRRLIGDPKIWIEDLIRSSEAWGRIQEGLVKKNIKNE